MLPIYDPCQVELPSEEAARAIERTLIFKRRTIWSVHISAIVIGLALFSWSMANRTALLTPIDPSFRASLIGTAVFFGVLLAVVEREAWLLGIGDWRGRGLPKGLGVWVGMLALVLASGFGGNFLAQKLWEWQAFHGLSLRRSEQIFTVVGRHSSRSGDWLDLEPGSEASSVPISCSYEMYQAVHAGDRLVLPVETGRRRVQRVFLPALSDLRRT